MGQKNISFANGVATLAKRGRHKKIKGDKTASQEYLQQTARSFSHLVRKDAGLASSSEALWKEGHTIALRGGGEFVLEAIDGIFEHHSNSLAMNHQFGNALAGLVEADPENFGPQVLSCVTALTRLHGYEFAANPSMGNVISVLASHGFAEEAAKLFYVLSTLDPESVAGDKHSARALQSLSLHGEEVQALSTYRFLADHKPCKLAENPARAKTERILGGALDGIHHPAFDAMVDKLNLFAEHAPAMRALTQVPRSRN